MNQTDGHAEDAKGEVFKPEPKQPITLKAMSFNKSGNSNANHLLGFIQEKEEPA